MSGNPYTSVPVLLASEIYEFEKALIKKGIQVENLIDKASSLIAKTIFRQIKPHSRVLGLIGKGNNGRDCFESLKKLNSFGYSVGAVFISSDVVESYLKQDDLSFLKYIGILEEPSLFQDIKKFNPDVVLDGFFGIGFKLPFKRPVSDFFKFVNSLDCIRLAIDVPSGTEAESGFSDENAFKADITVTFFSLKPVHVLKPAKLYCGKIVLSDLGFASELSNFLSKKDFIRTKTLKKFEVNIKRPAIAHKKTFPVLVIAGSENMPGAAFLSAKAAFLSGSGYVAVASERRALHIIKNLLPDAVFIPVDFDRKEAVLELICRLKDFKSVILGPGLSREAKHQELAVELIRELSKTGKPSVIDGDGLYALSNIKEKLILSNSIVTPHPKEAERLFETSERNPIITAEKIAEKYRCVCVYKGSTIIISNGKKTIVFDEAVNNLAVAGSGDVLSGVIAALLAQGLETFDAASLAVQIQSSASKLAYKYLNGAPLTASEMIDYIRVQLKNLCGDWL